MADDALAPPATKSWLYHPVFPAHWQRRALYSLARWVNGLAFRDIQFSPTGRPGKGLILTESKLAEHSFYSCSARTLTSTKKRVANPDRRRCENALAVLDSPASQCHQVVWGRKYWEQLGSVANREAWTKLPCCPAAHAGYQLFRQQALAEGIASSGKYDLVASCVAMDERNDVLSKSLKSTGVARIEDWSRLFHGRARFSVFTHQQWVAWVRVHDDGAWAEWRSWIGTRYGLA